MRMALSSLMTGPTKVFGFCGSPQDSSLTSCASRVSTSFDSDSCTSSSCTEVQTWPALRKPALTILGSAASSLASSHTMVQAIEPSSICVRRKPAACWILRPTSVLPVKAKKRTRSSSCRCFTTSALPCSTDEEARGHAGFQQHLGQQAGGQRRVGGGLEDDRVAGRKGRRHLVRHGVERRVEGRDGGHHAQRHAQREAQPAGRARGAGQRDHVAGQAARLLGRELEGLEAAAHLAQGIALREAGFELHGAHEFIRCAPPATRPRGPAPAPRS